MNWQQKLQGLANQAGNAFQTFQASPQMQETIENLQMAPLLKALDSLPHHKLERRVEEHRQRYADLTLDEQAHRLVIDRTVELARAGLVGNMVPLVGSLFSVSAEQSSQWQVELAAELAILYGKSPQEPEFRNEVAVLLTSVMAGKGLLKVGAGLLKRVPVGGAVVKASECAATTYAIGQAAMQYHRAIASGSAQAAAFSAASDGVQRYLEAAATQEQRMDQVLLHLALADIPLHDRPQLLERLQPLSQDPEGLAALVASAQSLPPLEQLLDGLDEEFGAVLLTQAEQLVRADGHVSPREAALLKQISDALRQDASVDAGDFGNRVLTTDFGATVRALAFSPDGEWLLAISDDRQLQGWRSYDGGIQYHQFYALQAHEKEIRCLALRGDRLYTAGKDCTIAVWDYRQGTLLRRFESGYRSGVRALAICGSEQLASGSRTGDITLWNVETGAARRSLGGHSDAVWALLSHPDGQRLFSGGNDHTVRVWDVASGECKQELKHPEGVFSLALCPDGTILATGCWDRKIRLWDLASGELRQILEGHRASVWQVAFSTDGRYLYSGADDNRVRIWDLTTGTQRLKLKGHSNGVYALAVSPVQPLLASGSWDRSVRLWSLELD